MIQPTITILTGEGTDTSELPCRTIFPDPTLPLLNRARPAEFVKRLDEGRQLGNVYSQRRNLDNTTNHPSAFYVEFPADSAYFQEVDAGRLARALGHSNGRGNFTRENVARLIDAIPADTDLMKFLHACRPQ